MTEAYDPTDRQDVRELEKAQRALDRQNEDVTRDIMRTAAGRGWMFRKLEACHVHRTTFTGDALQSAFHEGQRNVGLMLEAEILRACPEEFILMLREANERDTAIDTTRSNRKQRNANGADDEAGGNYVDYTAGAEAAAN